MRVKIQEEEGERKRYCFVEDEDVERRDSEFDVVRTIPIFRIFELEKRYRLSWSMEQTPFPNSLKTVGSGCGDKGSLEAGKSRLEG